MDKQRVVFTNGCFDLFHVGHLRFLTQARKFGDSLIVGLNSDESIRKIKGKNRPIITQEHRAEILAGLRVVNCVIIFDEESPLTLIKEIKPDILVKGEDWKEEDIIGLNFMKSINGKVFRIPLVPFVSTSEILDRIKTY